MGVVILAAGAIGGAAGCAYRFPKSGQSVWRDDKGYTMNNLEPEEEVGSAARVGDGF